MAVLTGSQVIPKYVNGDADQIALFALKNVAGGDTIDLSTIGNNASFQIIFKAIMLATTGAAGIASFTGAVVTLPAAVPAGSAGYLLVWGC